MAVWCEKCSTKDRLAHASCLAKYAARIADGVDDFRGWERCKVDGSKLERGPIVLDKPDDGDEKTIDSID